MLNLNDLHLFVRVVDHGSFAAAGRALGLPKSTLSKRVGELERSLGVRLIQRTSRSFTVTELGQDLYRHASAMVIEAETAEGLVRGRMAEPSGTVRITASVPTAQISLAPVLPDLARAYPRITILASATDRFVDIVQEGFDIALRSHFSPLPDSGLVQRKLGTDPGWLVASPAYLDARGRPGTPDEISRHDGLLTAPTHPSWQLEGEDGAAEAVPQARFFADESMILLEAAAAGLGIACLPTKLCRQSVEQGRLERVLPRWSTPGVTTTLLMPHRRGQLPSVRAVADFLIEKLTI